MPQYQFEDNRLHKTVVNNLKRRGYSQWLPIQQYVIAYLLRGMDVLGTAQTGEFIIIMIYGSR